MAMGLTYYGARHASSYNLQYRTKEQSTKILNKFTNSTSGQLNSVATQLNKSGQVLSLIISFLHIFVEMAKACSRNNQASIVK
jgi:HPt (histidine-containing phosphotransfer) domain-containing protein